MALKDFFSDDAKKRAADAVKHVESQTSAEVVITVRRLSGRYREADIAFGAMIGLCALLVLIFHPYELNEQYMPLDVALAFGLGAFICSRSDAIRRLVLLPHIRNAQVVAAAKSCFFDFGISRTTGRTGLLVYVSMLERRVAIVADLALEAEAPRKALTAAEARMSDAVARKDFAGFIAAVEALGPALGPSLPRAADDVNELPDEVR